MPPSIQFLKLKTCTSTFYNCLQTCPPSSHTYCCYNLPQEVKGIILKISHSIALSTQNLVSFLIGKSKSPGWLLKPFTMWLWSPFSNLISYPPLFSMSTVLQSHRLLVYFRHTEHIFSEHLYLLSLSSKLFSSKDLQSSIPTVPMTIPHIEVSPAHSKIEPSTTFYPLPLLYFS